MIQLMIVQHTSLAALALFFISILVVASSTRAAHSLKNCLQFCGTGKSAKRVPYPFGFGGDCPIRLNCTHGGDIQIGGFQVQNITANGVLINLEAECNRPVEQMKSLFSKHYALAWQNSLLLRNCSKPLDGCFISRSSLKAQLNLSSCGSGSDNLTCYSREDLGIDVLSYENVSKTQCKFVYSSLAIGPVSPVVSLQLQRAELEWWLDGDCNSSKGCDKNAECKQVRLGDGKVGFRCSCNDSFVGDGFAAGEGCRRGKSTRRSLPLLGFIILFRFFFFCFFQL
uniref:Wall-associated receptor kinase galacturonan-binding domain-containing protein n=1 Tax=Rhizophora mucronata TaxID=61149 RepID=A0A2P2MSN7_RHIMU